MSVRKLTLGSFGIALLVQLVIGGAALKELMKVAYPKDSTTGGAIEISLGTDVWKALGWTVVVLFIVGCLAATLDRDLEALALAGLSVLLGGALFQGFMTDAEVSLWPWGGLLALVGLVLAASIDLNGVQKFAKEALTRSRSTDAVGGPHRF